MAKSTSSLAVAQLTPNSKWGKEGISRRRGLRRVAHSFGYQSSLNRDHFLNLDGITSILFSIKSAAFIHFHSPQSSSSNLVRWKLLGGSFEVLRLLVVWWWRKRRLTLVLLGISHSVELSLIYLAVSQGGESNKRAPLMDCHHCRLCDPSQISDGQFIQSSTTGELFAQ